MVTCVCALHDRVREATSSRNGASPPTGHTCTCRPSVVSRTGAKANPAHQGAQLLHTLRPAHLFRPRLLVNKDAFSGRIVGYSIDHRMKARLAVDALESAVARRGDVAGCIVHSDRGSQFRSRKFVHALTRHGLTGSMGRVGAAGDNAAMESFIALLQKNVLDRRPWTTRQELRTAIVTWIERTHHRRRRQLRLGRLTPIEFEITMKPAALAA